ncbi:hypothetical protein C2857_000700 [Epichloe festucae Fl1]|uniref:Uncharacterized protein n=1 Tax=Epichloe festucae (strain Fl1) TaxID=877507 RepID=A0A7S9KJM1_EPIFF|nr:hypothetical protein C2857_000700 [Epichloe festucae Fl1]
MTVVHPSDAHEVWDGQSRHPLREIARHLPAMANHTTYKFGPKINAASQRAYSGRAAAAAAAAAAAPSATSNPTTADGDATILLDRKRQDGRHTRPTASPPGEETAPPPPPPPPPGPRVITGPAEQVPVSSYDYEATGSSGAIPTVDSPFNFPAGRLPPPSPRARQQQQQQQQQQHPSYPPNPPSLLAHGITEQAWRSFLDTVSAFLTAKVSDRVIAHAADVAKSLGEPHVNYGKSLANHAKTVGRQIARDARRLNLWRVAANVIGGAVSIPVHAALGAVHAISAIPSTALAAVSKTPKTPLQRAATYSAVASKDWLNARGLHAVLLDTRQLAEVVRVPPDTLLDIAAEGGRTGGAAGTMGALEGHLEKLSVSEDKAVVLSAQSLWLVLVPLVAEIDGSK